MPIQFIGQVTGVTSATLPAHQAGDLILAFAYRDGSTTPPTQPSGQNWSQIRSQTGANTNSCRTAFKIAQSSSEATGTWTNATSVVFLVYRGVKQSDPIGNDNETGGNSTTVTFPALTMEVTDGSSWVVGFAGHRAVNTSLENPPTGMTNRANDVDATDEASGHDTNGGVTSWSATNVSVGGTSSGWRGVTIEILAALVVQPGTGQLVAAGFAPFVNALTISGTVKYNGSPVEGVKVHLINTTDDVYVSNQTSDVNGEFSFVGLDNTKEYHAVPEMYFDGEINWTTFSKPFLNV